MVLTYLYDGSFEGFLSCVYHSYYDKDKPTEIVSKFDYRPDLIHYTIDIATNNIEADKVYEAIRNKISEEALTNVFYVFLSNIENSDTLLYNYIKLGFKLGSEVDMHLHNDIVLTVHKISRKVGLEKHSMLGFIRFKELKNKIFYSSIEPDHNIIGLIAPHFAARLADQNWIIHDIKRELAVIYNTIEWILIPCEKNRFDVNSIRDENIIYENLWKDYFENIAISERKNPRLQKRMMPQRYWKHLTEFR